MPFIVYNLTDPDYDDRSTDYVVVKDTLEEAEASFTTAVEDLKLGESFYLVEVDTPRGQLHDEALHEGIQNEWKGHNSVIHMEMGHTFAENSDLPDWEDDEDEDDEE